MSVGILGTYGAPAGGYAGPRRRSVTARLARTLQAKPRTVGQALPGGAAHATGQLGIAVAHSFSSGERRKSINVISKSSLKVKIEYKPLAHEGLLHPDYISHPF